MILALVASFIVMVLFKVATFVQIACFTYTIDSSMRMLRLNRRSYDMFFATALLFISALWISGKLSIMGNVLPTPDGVLAVIAFAGFVYGLYRLLEYVGAFTRAVVVSFIERKTAER